MKAITIIQPWATFLALEEKRFETRSWATRHRGSIAIHAGKKVDKRICREEPFRSILAKHGYTADNLPTGAVIALANLQSCYAVTRPCGEKGDVWLEAEGKLVIWDAPRLVALAAQEGHEYAFGDYRDGRYAWEMTDVQLLEKPLLAKGMQGLWNWEEAE
ncbi:2-oxoglutarate dehydrogenase E1 [Paenibacillus woosongensis]|uniref:ASCH domain-containing protein n=1 Tax=Paenibacillus woosongensis TaxID=307580 RepID=A0A7X2Z172_9BACL|nr:ASCH domain-containing protein [Paenibacillus woosongensis]